MQIVNLARPVYHFVIELISTLVQRIRAIISRAVAALTSYFADTPPIPPTHIRQIQMIRPNATIAWQDDALQTERQVVAAWIQFIQLSCGLEDPPLSLVCGQALPQLPPKNLILAAIRERLPLHSEILTRCAMEDEEVARACLVMEQEWLDHEHIVDLGNRWPWFAYECIRSTQSMREDLLWELFLSACSYAREQMQRDEEVGDFNEIAAFFEQNYLLPLTEDQIQLLIGYGNDVALPDNPFDRLVISLLSRGILDLGVIYSPTIDFLRKKPPHWNDTLREILEGPGENIHPFLLGNPDQEFQEAVAYLQAIKQNHPHYTKVQMCLGHLYLENQLCEAAGFAFLEVARWNRQGDKSLEETDALRLAAYCLLFRTEDNGYVLRRGAEVPPSGCFFLNPGDVTALVTPGPSGDFPLIKTLLSLQIRK